MKMLAAIIFLLSTNIVYGCEADFKAFFSLFETDANFQLRNTAYPLPTTYVDMAALPEPKLVESTIDKPRGKPIFPVGYLLKSDKDIGLRVATVKLYKPDSGYQLIYTFEKEDGCWKLTRYDNPST